MRGVARHFGCGQRAIINRSNKITENSYHQVSVIPTELSLPHKSLGWLTQEEKLD